MFAGSLVQKIIFYLVLAAVIIAALAGIYYKIDAGGYDRCVAKYEKAAADQKTKAEAEILKTEKAYDKIKTKILRDRSPNDPVGPRVEFAIDSLRDPDASHR